MPVRESLRKRIGAEFTEEHRRQLETGHSFFGDYGEPTDNTLRVMRRDWEARRRGILRDWIKERPGSRPWAWWFLDAPEMRRCWRVEQVKRANGYSDFKRGPRLDLEAEIAGMPEWARMLESRNWFGKLAVSPGLCEWESEEEFLERHGLMGKDERRRCKE